LAAGIPIALALHDNNSSKTNSYIVPTGSFYKFNRGYDAMATQPTAVCILTSNYIPKRFQPDPSTRYGSQMAQRLLFTATVRNGREQPFCLGYEEETMKALLLGALLAVFALHGCGSGSKSDSNTDGDGKADSTRSQVSFRVPLLSGDDVPVLLSTYNDKLVAAGKDALPDFITVTGDKKGYNQYNDLWQKMESIFEELNMDTYMLSAATPGAYIAKDAAGNDISFCFIGDVSKVADGLSNISDSVLSDQFTIWGYKYGSVEKFDDGYDRSDFASALTEEWTKGDLDKDTFMVLYTVSDGGEDMTVEAIKRCVDIQEVTSALRIPLLNYSDAEKTGLLSQFNDRLVAAGYETFPDTMELTTGEAGYNEFHKWLNYADKVAEELNLDVAMASYGVPNDYVATNAAGQDVSICFLGDVSKAVDTLAGMADMAFSDQFVIWAWKYDNVEKFSEYLDDPEEAKSDLPIEWSNPLAKDSIMVVYSITDGGDHWTAATIKKCVTTTAGAK
jgi:hypothetical protein